MVNPEIVAVDIGFLKLVTENATSVPPETLVPYAPVTVKTELEKAQESVADNTATVEHEILPWR